MTKRLTSSLHRSLHPSPLLPPHSSSQTSTTAKPAHKLPSPPGFDEEDEFELDEAEADDSADDDFAPTNSAATSKRPRRASALASSGSTQSNHRTSPTSPELTATGGKPSNRKVSHSLIERRRREKINDCRPSPSSISSLP